MILIKLTLTVGQKDIGYSVFLILLKFLQIFRNGAYVDHFDNRYVLFDYIANIDLGFNYINLFYLIRQTKISRIIVNFIDISGNLKNDLYVFKPNLETFESTTKIIVNLMHCV